MHSRPAWRRIGLYFCLISSLVCVLLIGAVDNSPSQAAVPVAPAAQSTPQASQPRHGRGFVPAPFELGRIWGEPRLGPQSASSLERFDWREQGKVTRVQNQSTCGSCYAFGSLGSLEAQMLIRNQPRYDFSENNIVECYYEASERGQNGCDGGNSWLVANHLSAFGTVLESCDPYSPANQACLTGCPYIKTVTEMWELYGTYPPVESLKNWLRNYGPLYVTINAGENDAWGYEFENYNGSYTLYYPTNDPNLNNHAVLLVGWDDSLQHQGATLGNLAGRAQVWIAFAFQTDEDTNYREGAFVDNIVLHKRATGSSGLEPGGEAVPAFGQGSGMRVREASRRLAPSR